MKKTFGGIIILAMAGALRAQGNALESDYTLGRITGGGVFSNIAVLGPFNNEWTTLLNVLSFQLGKDDRRQFGFTFLGGGVLLPALILGISDINCAFRAGSGNRIRFDVQTNMTSTILAEGGFHELDQGSNGYFACLLQWDFLSRQGNIVVDPDYYDMAFYFGPQVNRGQFGFRSGCQTFAHNENQYSSYNNGGFYVLPVLGITERFQVSGRVNYFPSSVVYGNTLAGIRGDYRLPHFQLSPGWLLKQRSIENVNYEYETRSLHELFLEGTFVSGHHVGSVDQVRGNWDGSFSDMLGPLQLLGRTSVSSSFTPNDTFFHLSQYPFSNTYFLQDEWVPPLFRGHLLWSASQNLRFGLLPDLTLGSDYNLLSQDGMKPRHHLSVNATFSNFTPREKGPSEVSKFEYAYGHLPREKEFKVSARYRLPITAASSMLYGGPISLSSYTTAETIGNGFWPYNFFFSPAAFGAAAGSYEWPPQGYDFVLSASVGAGWEKGRLVASNALGIADIDVYDWWSGGTHSTTIISDNISFTVPMFDRSAFSFGFQGSGQTDKNATGLDSFYCIIYFNFFRAL